MPKGEKISKLYWAKALVARGSVNAMDIEASLWHQRLSHISEKGLNCLAKKDMLSGLKNTDLEKCSHCMVGKQTNFNLISVQILDDAGYDNHFGSGKWKLTKGNLVVAKGEKISKLYWTKALVAKDSVNAMDMEASL